MPKIESPLGTQNLPSRPLRHVQVPDESGYSQQGGLPNTGFAPPMPTQVPLPQASPHMGENFAPSVSRRMNRNFTEEEIRQLQEQMRAQAEPDSQLSDVEREFKQLRADKRRGIERLNDAARKRLELLMGMTRGKRQAEIEGNLYAFQTLKNNEMEEAIAEAAEFDGTVRSPFEVRKQLLARSLTHVAGLEFSQFVGSNLLEDKLLVIDNMDHALLLRLYDEYLTMVKEVKERYSISKEAAPEVAEDLKK